MRPTIAALALLLVATATDTPAQTPRPFPGAGTGTSPSVQDPSTPTRQSADPLASPPALAPGEPTAEALWFPAYPAAQFIAAYDAGRSQHYYLYGATAPFEDIVGYYRSTLNERGRLVFREPPTHMFEVGRFREETMAFPPGVTVKDWTWGGSEGYPNPTPNATPARFPTVIMIVPPPPGTER